MRPGARLCLHLAARTAARFGRSLASLAALIVLAAAALLVVGNLTAARPLIEFLTAELSGGQVRLQGLSGRFPDRLRAQRLSLADPQGTWLQAEQVALDWSPLPLFDRRVDVAQLSATRVQVLRRPAYGAGGAGAAGRRGGADNAEFRLPVAIRIDRIELPDVQLAAALAGAPAALRIAGGGRFASLRSASLQLSASRLDSVPATYRLNAQFSPGRVQLHVDVAEPADGPLANLLRLPGLGALSVHAVFDGPSDAIATELEARAGSLQAHAGGTVDLAGGAATLDVALQAPAMTPRPGLSWRSVTLQVHARGAFTAPATRAQLQLEGFSAGALQVQALQLTLQGQGQALSLAGMIDGLTLPAPLNALLHAAPLTLLGQLRLPVGAGPGLALDLHVSHPLLQAQAHYQYGPVGSARGALAGSAANVGSGTVTATLPTLAPWAAALAHVDLQGRASVQGRLQRSQTQQLSLSAALSISGGDARLTRLLAPRASVFAQLNFVRGGLRLPRSQLDAAYLHASAQGMSNHSGLDLTWQCALPDLGALAPGAVGQLAAHGRVQGMLPSLALSASADASFRAQRAPGMLHLELQSAGLPRQPSGQIELSGSLDGAPLALQADLQSTAGAYSLQIRRADWRSAQLQGSLSMAANTSAPQGQLSLRVRRLADLNRLVEDPLAGGLSGSLTAQLAFEEHEGGSRLRVQVQGQDVGLPAVQLARLQLSGSIDEPLRAPQLALALSAAGTLRGVPAQLSATARGASAAVQLHAEVATGGAAQTASQLDADATWRAASGELELTGLTGHYRRQTLRLLEPAHVSFTHGVLVDHLRLAVPPAVLQLQGRLAPQLALRASVVNLASTMLGAVLPEFRGLQPRGSATADLQLQGSFAQPHGTFTFTATGLRSASGAVRGLPAAAIKVAAQLAGGGADIDVAMDAGTYMQLRASGRIPLQPTGAIALKLTGNMDLSFANPVLEAGGERVLGQLALQGQVGGTLAAPQARGQLTIRKADLQDFARGLHVSDLNLTLEAEGSQVRLTQMSAQAGSGKLSAGGSIDLMAPGLPVQFSITGRHLQALRSDLLTADLDLDLRATGTLLPRDLKVSGTSHVNKATINIPNALPPDVAVLKVVRPGQQTPVQEPETPLIAMLNLTINAPNGIFVRGRGLNAQVGGTLQVTGNSTHPNVAGGFDLINGTLDLSGSTLTFNSGRLGFNGTGLHHRIDPTLDFTATTYSGGITATLTVGGYADAPVFSFSSTPALPQDEIMARLLFGESVAQLSPLQIAGVGAALVTMTGVGGGGFNPLTTVQHALGLNRLVFSSGSGTTTGASPTGVGGPQYNPGATVEAGRYITNRIYVGAKQSTNGLTQAQVQVDLTRSWKVQTTLSSGGGTVQGVTPENDPGSSVGMSYQFEF